MRNVDIQLAFRSAYLKSLIFAGQDSFLWQHIDYVSFFSYVLCGMPSLHRPCTNCRHLDGTDVRAFLFSDTEKPGTGNTPVLCPAPGNFFSFYVKRCRHPSMAMYFFSSISGFFGSVFGMLSFNTPLSYFAWISSCFTSSPT